MGATNDFHGTCVLSGAMLSLGSSLNIGYYDRDGVWTCDLNYHRFLRFFSIRFLFSVSLG